MKKLHGISYQAHVDEIVDVIKELYQFYVTSRPSSQGLRVDQNEPSVSDIDTSYLLVDNNDDELESYLYQSSQTNEDELNELDKYMADPPMRFSGQFDILAWWKNQIHLFLWFVTLYLYLLLVLTI